MVLIYIFSHLRQTKFKLAGLQTKDKKNQNPPYTVNTELKFASGKNWPRRFACTMRACVCHA